MGTFTAIALPEVKAKTVALLGFDGVSAWDLGGPVETLTAAHLDVAAGRIKPCYSPAIIGVTGKTFATEAGLVVTAHDVLRKNTTGDILIIPGGAGIRNPDVRRKVADWLMANGARLQRIVAIGAGIYPLAQSGLLDERRVTTHWRFAQDVARKFPSLRVDQTVASTKDGPFYSCGGGTAAVELMLGLIEEDYGRGIALSVARELALRLRPIADPESELERLHFDYGPADRLADLPAWISGHLEENLSVESLAERACLCPRHFRRLFKRIFKITPAAFVEQIRIAEAERRLLLPRTNIENLAAAVGFKSSDSFRRAFARRRGISPTIYRKKFRRPQSDTRAPHLFAA